MIKQSSAPRLALLFHRARRRKAMATVAITPSGMLACLIRSPPGFGVIVATVGAEHRRRTTAKDMADVCGRTLRWAKDTDTYNN